MANEVLLKKLTLDGSSYFLLIQWEASGLSLTLAGDSLVWQRDISDSYLNETLRPKRMKMDEYRTATYDVMRSEDPKNGLLELLRKGQDIHLIWRIIVGTSLKLSSEVKMERIPAKNHENVMLMDKLMDLVNTRTKFIREIENVNEKVRERNDELLMLIDQLSEERKREGEEYMKKFLLVLNEKKKVISDLKKKLQEVPVETPQRRESRKNIRKERIAYDGMVADDIGSMNGQSTQDTQSSPVLGLHEKEAAGGKDKDENGAVFTSIVADPKEKYYTTTKRRKRKPYAAEKVKIERKVGKTDNAVKRQRRATLTSEELAESCE